MRHGSSYARDPFYYETTAEIPVVRQLPPPAGAGGRPAGRRGGRRQWPGSGSRPPSWLWRALLGGVVLVALLGLADLGLSLTSTPSTTPAAKSAAGAHAANNTRHKGRNRHLSKAHRHPASHPPGASSAKAGGPELFFAEPRRVHAGQTFTVYGANLVSSNGVVLARVAGHPSRTYCPSRTSCQVTAPDLPKRNGWLRVTISTSAGQSNSVWIRYRPSG